MPPLSEDEANSVLQLRKGLETAVSNGDLVTSTCLLQRLLRLKRSNLYFCEHLATVTTAAAAAAEWSGDASDESLLTFWKTFLKSLADWMIQKLDSAASRLPQLEAMSDGYVFYVLTELINPATISLMFPHRTEEWRAMFLKTVVQNIKTTSERLTLCYTGLCDALRKRSEKKESIPLRWLQCVREALDFLKALAVHGDVANALIEWEPVSLVNKLTYLFKQRKSLIAHVEAASSSSQPTPSTSEGSAGIPTAEGGGVFSPPPQHSSTSSKTFADDTRRIDEVHHAALQCFLVCLRHATIDYRDYLNAFCLNISTSATLDHDPTTAGRSGPVAFPDAYRHVDNVVKGLRILTEYLDVDPPALVARGADMSHLVAMREHVYSELQTAMKQESSSNNNKHEDRGSSPLLDAAAAQLGSSGPSMMMQNVSLVTNCMQLLIHCPPLSVLSDSLNEICLLLIKLGNRRKGQDPSSLPLWRDTVFSRLLQSLPALAQTSPAIASTLGKGLLDACTVSTEVVSDSLITTLARSFLATLNVKPVAAAVDPSEEFSESTAGTSPCSQLATSFPGGAGPFGGSSWSSNTAGGLLSPPGATIDILGKSLTMSDTLALRCVPSLPSIESTTKLQSQLLRGLRWLYDKPTRRVTATAFQLNQLASFSCLVGVSEESRYAPAVVEERLEVLFAAMMSGGDAAVHECAEQLRQDLVVLLKRIAQKHLFSSLDGSKSASIANLLGKILHELVSSHAAAGSSSATHEALVQVAFDLLKLHGDAEYSSFSQFTLKKLLSIDAFPQAFKRLVDEITASEPQDEALPSSHHNHSTCVLSILLPLVLNLLKTELRQSGDDATSSGGASNNAAAALGKSSKILHEKLLKANFVEALCQHTLGSSPKAQTAGEDAWFVLSMLLRSAGGVVGTAPFDATSRWVEGQVQRLRTPTELELFAKRLLQAATWESGLKDAITLSDMFAGYHACVPFFVECLSRTLTFIEELRSEEEAASRAAATAESNQNTSPLRDDESDDGEAEGQQQRQQLAAAATELLLPPNNNNNKQPLKPVSNENSSTWESLFKDVFRAMSHLVERTGYIDSPLLLAWARERKYSMLLPYLSISLPELQTFPFTGETEEMLSFWYPLLTRPQGRSQLLFHKAGRGGGVRVRVERLPESGLTFSAWFQFADTQKQCPLFHVSILGANGVSTPLLSVTAEKDSLVLAAPPAAQESAPLDGFVSGKWSHFTCVLSSAGMVSVYFYGVVVRTESLNNFKPGCPLTFFIGAEKGGCSYALSDMQCWADELLAGQVLADFCGNDPVRLPAKLLPSDVAREVSANKDDLPVPVDDRIACFLPHMNDARTRTLTNNVKGPIRVTADVTDPECVLPQGYVNFDFLFLSRGGLRYLLQFIADAEEDAAMDQALEMFAETVRYVSMVDTIRPRLYSLLEYHVKQNVHLLTEQGVQWLLRTATTLVPKNGTQHSIVINRLMVEFVFANLELIRFDHVHAIRPAAAVALLKGMSQMYSRENPFAERNATFTCIHRITERCLQGLLRLIEDAPFDEVRDAAFELIEKLVQIQKQSVAAVNAVMFVAAAVAQHTKEGGAPVAASTTASTQVDLLPSTNNNNGILNQGVVLSPSTVVVLCRRLLSILIDSHHPSIPTMMTLPWFHCFSATDSSVVVRATKLFFDSCDLNINDALMRDVVSHAAAFQLMLDAHSLSFDLLALVAAALMADTKTMLLTSQEAPLDALQKLRRTAVDNWTREHHSPKTELLAFKTVLGSVMSKMILSLIRALRSKKGLTDEEIDKASKLFDELSKAMEILWVTQCLGQGVSQHVTLLTFAVQALKHKEFLEVTKIEKSSLLKREESSPMATPGAGLNSGSFAVPEGDAPGAATATGGGGGGAAAAALLPPTASGATAQPPTPSTASAVTAAPRLFQVHALDAGEEPVPEPPLFSPEGLPVPLIVVNENDDMATDSRATTAADVHERKEGAPTSDDEDDEEDEEEDVAFAPENDPLGHSTTNEADLAMENERICRKMLEYAKSVIVASMRLRSWSSPSSSSAPPKLQERYGTTGVLMFQLLRSLASDREGVVRFFCHCVSTVVPVCKPPANSATGASTTAVLTMVRQVGESIGVTQFNESENMFWNLKHFIRLLVDEVILWSVEVHVIIPLLDNVLTMMDTTAGWDPIRAEISRLCVGLFLPAGSYTRADDKLIATTAKLLEKCLTGRWDCGATLPQLLAVAYNLWSAPLSTTVTQEQLARRTTAVTQFVHAVLHAYHKTKRLTDAIGSKLTPFEVEQLLTRGAETADADLHKDLQSLMKKNVKHLKEQLRTEVSTQKELSNVHREFLAKLLEQTDMVKNPIGAHFKTGGSAMDATTPVVDETTLHWLLFFSAVFPESDPCNFSMTVTRPEDVAVVLPRVVASEEPCDAPCERPPRSPSAGPAAAAVDPCAGTTASIATTASTADDDADHDDLDCSGDIPLHHPNLVLSNSFGDAFSSSPASPRMESSASPLRNTSIIAAHPLVPKLFIGHRRHYFDSMRNCVPFRPLCPEDDDANHSAAIVDASLIEEQTLLISMNFPRYVTRCPPPVSPENRRMLLSESCKRPFTDSALSLLQFLVLPDEKLRYACNAFRIHGIHATHCVVLVTDAMIKVLASSHLTEVGDLHIGSEVHGALPSHAASPIKQKLGTTSRLMRRAKTFIGRGSDVKLNRDDEPTKHVGSKVTSGLLAAHQQCSISRGVMWLYYLNNVARLQTLHYLHQDVGLGIWLAYDEGPLLAVVDSQLAMTAPARDELLEEIKNAIPKDQVVEIIDKKKKVDTLAIVKDQWLQHRSSNYEYLMFLNRVSSRIRGDWSQYPVMPWVLRDYSSDVIDLRNADIYRDLTLPIGAQTEERRLRLKTRFDQLLSFASEGDAFQAPSHYATHYSSAGGILYYLLRIEPFTTRAKILQSGHFDKADRLFGSVEAAFRSCTQSDQDCKELVPEFYSNGSFLENLDRLDLGTLQSGEMVDDVRLPPWAQGSHQLFVWIMRAALESEAASSALHAWIDLIFGDAQDGERAQQRFNVYSEISQASQFMDKMRSAKGSDSDAIISEAENFGQTPLKLFTEAHPPKASKDASLDLPASSGGIHNAGATPDPTAQSLPPNAHIVAFAPFLRELFLHHQTLYLNLPAPSTTPPPTATVATTDEGSGTQQQAVVVEVQAAVAAPPSSVPPRMIWAMQKDPPQCIPLSQDRLQLLSIFRDSPAVRSFTVSSRGTVANQGRVVCVPNTNVALCWNPNESRLMRFELFESPSSALNTSMLDGTVSNNGTFAGTIGGVLGRPFRSLIQFALPDAVGKGGQITALLPCTKEVIVFVGNGSGAIYCLHPDAMRSRLLAGTTLCCHTKPIAGLVTTERTSRLISFTTSAEDFPIVWRARRLRAAMLHQLDLSHISDSGDRVVVGAASCPRDAISIVATRRHLALYDLNGELLGVGKLPSPSDAGSHMTVSFSDITCIAQFTSAEWADGAYYIVCGHQDGSVGMWRAERRPTTKMAPLNILEVTYGGAIVPKFIAEDGTGPFAVTALKQKEDAIPEFFVGYQNGTVQLLTMRPR